MINLLRLASKVTSKSMGLPHGINAGNTKLRTKIRLLQTALKSSKSVHPKPDSLNNKVGSYDKTGVNQLSKKHVGRVKYMKRQKHFVWLPTHIWNAKRSHMFKRWGYHLPWSPTQKNFKLTHRLTGNVACSDGAMVCDTSYMCNMVITSTSHDLLRNLMKELTNGRAVLPKYLNQHWFHGLVYLDNECLGCIDSLWCNDTSVLVRLHPSIYSQIFQHLVNSVDLNKFTFQDCRFSLGSITITGSKSLNALSHILRSTTESQSFRQFQKIARISDSNILPERTIFAFNALDPRFLANPRPLNPAPISTKDIIELEKTFLKDEISEILSKLINSHTRTASYTNQQTLKELARRRQNIFVSPDHQNMIPFELNDSQIPILLVKHQFSQQWSLILPWFWVLPFWYQLNKVNRVYHMGLKQFQQQSFTLKTLNFPDDYPFTQIGYDEGRIYKNEVLINLWQRKPVSKRVNFAKLGKLHKEQLIEGEIGSWFCCDWKLLSILQNGLQFLGKGNTQFVDTNKTSTYDSNNGLSKVQYIFDLFKLYECKKDEIEIPIELYRSSLPEIKEVDISTKKLPVVPISCTLIERGHPKDNARVYSIPSEDLSYWKSMAQGKYRAVGKRDHDTIQPLPHCYDLIGFLTSASFNLSEGNGSGIGFISAYAAISSATRYILIRNTGQTTYRLAIWQSLVM